MNEYINSLINQDKLRISTDKSIDFTWPLGDCEVGKDLCLISGPCSVESEEMIIDFSKILSGVGVDAIRGGAYKPCTYPIEKETNGWREGLREKGLVYLKRAAESTGLPVVTEVMEPKLVKMVSEYADVLQVGTRNFQNYPLLDALGKSDTPVLLKRGTWGTVDEILGAAERILRGGNRKIAICLRGVVGMPSYRHVFPSIRWAPDLMMIPALKSLTNIPVIYDPSHATGYSDFVLPVSKAAIAAGADGLIVECHPDPKNSISDADQAIDVETLKKIKNYMTREK